MNSKPGRGSYQLGQERFQFVFLSSAEPTIDDGTDVMAGLSQTPKTLPCRYFYDDRGSLLFEQICTLPEYYPTRTERAILETCAPSIAQLTGACDLVELGSGSSTKTRLLLEAYSQWEKPLCYFPIDVSGGILKTSALELLAEYPHLQVCGLVGTYEQALQQLPNFSSNPGDTDAQFADQGQRPRLLIFLGSTIGNFDPDACDTLLTQVKQALRPGDYFLLGVDLQKSTQILEPAYNDGQGITAEFNVNILQHLNDRFQGDFRLNQFQHLAFYNSSAHQIEIYLVSSVEQTVMLQTLDFQVNFQAGETILTEISRKFHLPKLTADLQTHGLRPLQTWTDPQNWFALLLCQHDLI
jgi:dimethylhistidine N-methyltransferase